jgi:flagellar biosynthetic protein FlhB
VNREQLTDNREQLTENREIAYNSLLPVNCSLSIDLQWFSDDNDPDAPGKTEQPTEHKLKKLREEGQVAKSQELSGALGLLLPALVLLFVAPFMFRTCVEMVRFFFLRATEFDPTKDAMIVGICLRYLIRLVWPMLLVAVITGIFSNLVQLGGWLFTTKPIIPDFSKAIPRFGQYFKRIFGSEGLFNLGKSIGKILIIGVIAFLFIRGDLNKLLNLQKTDLYSGLVIVASIAIRLLIVVAIFWLILSIADILFQRWRFREKHKMTRHELKEEMKQYQMDPQIQSRIRARFRELTRQNIAAAVPKADVVITNPTHLAVALQYELGVMKGPMVVAMGADELAAKIRNLAQEHEVPLYENKPLAWALYRETNVGDIVPESHWNVVAFILRKVGYLNEKRRKKMAA